MGLGTRHPLSIVRNEIIDIFARMGFNIADGPEVEDDLHVYTKLNFAADHPARDMQDTFFVDVNAAGDVTKNIILRSHTSSVRCAPWSTPSPPSASSARGASTANEAISYRAHCFFHQVEGLYIDKGVSFTDLKQVLLLFAQEMFGSDTKIRLRPSYFPSPSRAPRWTSAATSAAARDAPSASTRDGWKSWAAAWWTPTCWTPAA